MKSILIKNNGEVIDITEIIGEFKISGSAKECSRVLDIPVLRHKLDYYLPSVPVEPGDIIELYEEGNGGKIEVFKGICWDIDLEDNNIKQEVTAYDYAIYLNKSDPKKQVFTNTTGAKVTKEILSELGLKAGDIAEGVTDSYNGRNMNAYDLIMHAYTKANKKNKKEYKLVAKGEEIHVFESGEKHPIVLEELDEPLVGKLLNTRYRKSLEDMVNKVEVIDEKDKDKKEDKGEKKKSQDQYGIVQKIIRGEKADIEGTLKDAKIEAEVEVIADWDMMTGKSIQLKSTILSGEFYIIEDEHSYSDGIHTARLKLSTEFEMDTKEEGASEANKTDAKGGNIQASGSVAKMLSIGKSKIGSRYSWGAAGPNRFDCSGFVSWCGIQAGFMPPGSRITSGNMSSKYVHKVTWSDLRPGDIVHFSGNPGHVGIYYGNGQVLECGGTSSGKLGYSGVAITSLNGRRSKFKNVYRFNKAG